MSSLPRLKILVLTPQLPYPPEQGTSLRNFHILRGLAQWHEVHLLSFLEPQQESARPSPLHDLCTQVVTVPSPQRTTGQRMWRLLADRRPDMAHRLQSAAFDVKLREILSREEFDIVQIEGIELAATVGLVRSFCPQCKIIFDDHNAEAELQRRMFVTDAGDPRRWAAAAYSLIQWRRLQKFERRACLSADGVSVVSEADSAHLRALAPAVDPMVIPNSIDMDLYQNLSHRDGAEQCDLLFIGKMDYRPNVDAVLWFGSEIWPLIRHSKPGLTWAIVGKQPHPRLRLLTREPGIVVTGMVPDIKPYLANANVYVMPFRIGSGTRLKLIEALASGVAMVSTRVGAEGYPLVAGRHLLLEDEPAAFADAVLRLLDDEALRQKLQSAGKEFAAKYDWRRVMPKFNELYRRTLIG